MANSFGGIKPLKIKNKKHERGHHIAPPWPEKKVKRQTSTDRNAMQWNSFECQEQNGVAKGSLLHGIPNLEGTLGRTDAAGSMI